jgi:hypothetical protein
MHRPDPTSWPPLPPPAPRAAPLGLLEVHHRQPPASRRAGAVGRHGAAAQRLPVPRGRPTGLEAALGLLAAGRAGARRPAAGLVRPLLLALLALLPCAFAPLLVLAFSVRLNVRVVSLASCRRGCGAGCLDLTVCISLRAVACCGCAASPPDGPTFVETCAIGRSTPALSDRRCSRSKLSRAPALPPFLPCGMRACRCDARAAPFGGAMEGGAGLERVAREVIEHVLHGGGLQTVQLVLQPQQQLCGAAAGAAGQRGVAGSGWGRTGREAARDRGERGRASPAVSHAVRAPRISV